MVSVRAPATRGAPPPAPVRPIQRRWLRFAAGVALLLAGALLLLASASDAVVVRRGASEELRTEVKRVGLELQRMLAQLQSTLDGLEDAMGTSASDAEKELQLARMQGRLAPLVTAIEPHRQEPPWSKALRLVSSRGTLHADLDAFTLRDRLSSLPLMSASLQVTLQPPGAHDASLPARGWLHASLVVPLPGKHEQELLVVCRKAEDPRERARQIEAVEVLSTLAWSSYDNVFGPRGNEAYAPAWMMRIQEAATDVPSFESYQLRAPGSDALRGSAERQLYRIPLAGSDVGVAVDATRPTPDVPLLGLLAGALLLVCGLALATTGSPWTRETTLGAAAMQAAPGMLLAGDDGRIRICNESAARLMRGDDGTDALPDLMRAVVRHAGEQIQPAWGELSRARSGGPAVPDLLLRSNRGDLIPVVHASRTEDGLLLVLDGASPLPTLRQRLIDSEEHLRAVMEGVPAPMLEVDGTLHIVHINADAAALAGIAPERATGTLCHETLFGLPSPCPGCPLQAVLASRQTMTAPAVVLQGRSFDRTLAFLPLAEPSAVEHLRDRSAEEKLRVELGISEQHARIGHIAASVAHDLRNPLLVISAAAESLRGLGLGDRPRELTGYILEEVHRLDSFTRDILDYARTDESFATPFHMGVIASSAVSAVALLRKEHRVEVESRVAPDAEPVMGDPEQIRRALVNLLTNAVQFAGEGGRVVVVTGGDAERACVRIEDSGPGVPADRAEDIFRPFVTTRRGGSGLGLAIARRLAEQAGGGVRLVPAQLLAGAAFELSLPRRRSRP